MSLSSLFNQQITIYNKASFDRYGREQVGSGSTHKARVQVTSKPRLQFAPEGGSGTQYIIAAVVYLKPDVTVNEGDKITYNSVNYRVHAKHLPTDGTGQTNHIKLELTKWQI